MFLTLHDLFVELRELTDSARTKLCAMTDEDFDQLELYPDFDQ